MQMDLSENKALVVLLFGKRLFNILPVVLAGVVRLCASLSPQFPTVHTPSFML